MNYLDVPSIVMAIEKSTQLGGQVALPKTRNANIGALGAIIDPQGNFWGGNRQSKKAGQKQERDREMGGALRDSPPRICFT